LSFIINESDIFSTNKEDWLLFITFIDCCDTLSIACAVIKATTANVPAKKIICHLKFSIRQKEAYTYG
jgi:hypothetical protein